VLAFHHVKNVTVNTKMFCISFRLSVEDARLTSGLVEDLCDEDPDH